MLDNVLELLVLGGRDIRHALTMLVPEAWERVPDMDPAWRAFYQYHAGLIEPWDGPAALAFSDGEVVGLALDRNGLRPARYLLTDDGLVVCGSEVGAVLVDEARDRSQRQGRPRPDDRGRPAHRALRGQRRDQARAGGPAALRRVARAQMQVLPPAGMAHIAGGYGRSRRRRASLKSALLGELQHAFGYTTEELAVILRPMLRDGQEPVGSMGDDTPPAVLRRARPPAV